MLCCTIRRSHLITVKVCVIKGLIKGLIALNLVCTSVKASGGLRAHALNRGHGLCLGGIWVYRIAHLGYILGGGHHALAVAVHHHYLVVAGVHVHIAVIVGDNIAAHHIVVTIATFQRHGMYLPVTAVLFGVYLVVDVRLCGSLRGAVIIVEAVHGSLIGHLGVEVVKHLLGVLLAHSTGTHPAIHQARLTVHTLHQLCAILLLHLTAQLVVRAAGLGNGLKVRHVITAAIGLLSLLLARTAAALALAKVHAHRLVYSTGILQSGLLLSPRVLATLHQVSD